MMNQIQANFFYLVFGGVLLTERISNSFNCVKSVCSSNYILLYLLNTFVALLLLHLILSSLFSRPNTVLFFMCFVVFQYK